MERKKRKELLEKLSYSREKQNAKWKKHYDCRSIIEELIEELPPDKQNMLRECLSKMDKFIENLIHKIFVLEEAMADLHETVEEDSSWPDGDGGGCHGPGSPVV